jgi:hypothetical protein
MEEGPEPQEIVERSVEHHHQGHESAHEPEDRRREIMVAAITSALLAVCAAIGSLFSGHAANQAILKQTEASDRWAYFQAKSTKGHIYESDRMLLGVLGEVIRKVVPGEHGADDTIKSALQGIATQVNKYETEKQQIEEEARELEQESRHEFHKHHLYAMGIASFQVGIVLASISILIRYRAIWIVSLIAGAVGIVFVFVGLLA